MQEIVQNRLTDKQYNSIDVCKFIMSIVVVAIHTGPFINCNNAVFLKIYNTLTGLAVPFFFLASGYLLAVKMDEPFGSNNDLLRIKRQLKAIIRIYLIWTAIYAPLAIWHFISSRTPFLKAIAYYIRGMILVGEQYNSWPLWYLLSTIYALIIIGIVLKTRRSLNALVVLSVVAGLISAGCTRFVNYNGSFTGIMAIMQKMLRVSIINGRIFLGMVYIPIGMILARIKIPRIISFIGCVIGFVCKNYIKNSFISMYVGMITYAAFFCVVRDIRLQNKTIYSKLRSMSTVIYLTHMYI